MAQHFEAAIKSGTLQAGERLENEVELAARLGLSRPTVRSAFLYLANKGMVVRKRGAGTVVATERIDRDVELTSLYDDLAAAGRAPATEVTKNEVGHASDTVARALQLPERSLVICLERIRFADGEPIALMHNFLPAALVHLSTDMLARHGLYELLRASGIRLGSATQRMSAKNASLRGGTATPRDPWHGAADHGARCLRRGRPPGRVRPAYVPRVALRLHPHDATVTRRLVIRCQQEVQARPVLGEVDDSASQYA